MLSIETLLLLQPLARWKRLWCLELIDYIIAQIAGFWFPSLLFHIHMEVVLWECLRRRLPVEITDTDRRFISR